jgi:hypothetical protein
VLQRASSATIEIDIGFNRSGGREHWNLTLCSVLLRQCNNLLSIVLFLAIYVLLRRISSVLNNGEKITVIGTCCQSCHWIARK